MTRLKDLVCGMEFEEKDTRFVTEYDGMKFAFCSYSCQTEFEKDPSRFLRALREPSVKDLMTSDVKFVNGENSILEASKLMSEGNQGCILVLEEGKVVGIVTERDLVKRVLVEAIPVSKVLTKDIMTSPVVTVEPETSIENAAKIMSEYGIRRLPAVKDGNLLGILTSDQIAMSLAREKNFTDNKLNAVARYCVSPAKVYG